MRNFYINKTGVIVLANEQAAFISFGRFALPDLEYIADELEVVGKSWNEASKTGVLWLCAGPTNA
ncbi:hypothetical protein EKO24_015415 [Candidatus Methylobacter oryzae]|uniref:Uncharacterized protein n=1 Tax=Candidatus Methylobacter oryzae TaxID=2497749 RepID=A0ABY3C8C8_9GAMM|nr:hypothetical protein EKO24_015415 [Candidatus Methylobacter oryzae]